MRILFPPRCMVCDRLLQESEFQRGFHSKCESKLYIVQEPCCMHCGRPLVSAEQEYCFDCERHKKRFLFAQGRAVFEYRGEIHRSMYRFKYGNRREYAEAFAEMACSLWRPWIEKNQIDVIIPIPMYLPKQWVRGYNQAGLFGKALGRKLNLKCDTKAVSRKKNTKAQKFLNDVQRENNLKNAFHIADNIVKYKCVLLVDDIYTTGSTMNAVTYELLQAGVENVYVLSACIAKGF